MSLNPKAVKQPDAFLVETRAALDQASKNKPLWLGVLIAVLVIGLGWSLWTHQRQTQSLASRDAWFGATQTFEMERRASAGKSIGLAETYPKSLPALKELVQKFPKTRAAIESLFLLGSLHFEKGMFNEAIEFYSKARDQSSEAFDREMANLNLGLAFEALGKPSDALSALQKAYHPKSLMKGEILLAMARQQKALGQKDKASATYNQIESELPNSSHAKRATQLKGEL